MRQASRPCQMQEGGEGQAVREGPNSSGPQMGVPERCSSNEEPSGGWLRRGEGGGGGEGHVFLQFVGRSLFCS